MLIALLLLTLAPWTAQDREKKDDGLPKKGDIVVVKGCFKGSALESSSISKASEDEQGENEHFTEPLRYRLTGDKHVLKSMKANHDAEVVVVTAELRTNLPTRGPGARIGNSRIQIGVGGSRGMLGDAPPPVPVLKVSTFEITGIPCL